MSERVVSVAREIAADTATVFDVLADPANHHLIDGSGSVMASRNSNPTRLEMGSRFGMDMKLGIPYRIQNEVVEFEADRLIAWRHFGHHVWRYELEPLPNGNTLVTESFDWGSARVPKLYELAGYPDRHVINMTKTLERLASVVE
jgi:hypothetical protein